MSSRIRLLVGTVVLLLGGAVGVWLYGSRTPPGLSDHRVGVARLVPRPGIPPIPYEKVTLIDGTGVLLSVAGITDDGGPARGEIGLRRLPGGTEEHFYLSQGQRRTVQGVQIELLHVWVMPDASKSAADVRVTPASSK